MTRPLPPAPWLLLLLLLLLLLPRAGKGRLRVML
jgi:hypothetical protein